MIQKICSECTFAKKLSVNYLVCIRYPPAPGYLLERNRWTRVEPDWGCGEFKISRIKKNDDSKQETVLSTVKNGGNGK